MGKRRVRDRLRRVEAHLEGDAPVELRMVWADEDASAAPPGEVVIQLTWEDEGVRPGQEAERERDG